MPAPPISSSTPARAYAALAAALLAGCAGPGSETRAPEGAAVESPRAASIARESPVVFRGRDVALGGVVFVPGRAPAAGERHPAAVLLHGCDGLFDATGTVRADYREWAERFAEWGFVALLADSYSPRGARGRCDDVRPQATAERTADAYAALEYVAARRDVDPNAVFLVGWSQGASAVIGSIRPQAPGRRASGPQFNAVIAVLPECVPASRTAGARATRPLLLLHDPAQTAACAELGRALAATGTVRIAPAGPSPAQTIGAVKVFVDGQLKVR